MRLRLAVTTMSFGVSVVLACSSSGTGSLGNGAGGSSSGASGCAAMGSTAGDGQGYVQKEGCPTCHGTNLAGSTTALVSGAEPGLVIQKGHVLYPPNLTPDPTTGLGNWSNEEIVQAITEGIDNNSQNLCPEMGQHYPNMCATEANGIVAYLKSIPAVVNAIPGSCCPPQKGTSPCSGAQ